MLDFERERAYLSHDRFQNQFLASIAYDVNRPSSPDRNLKFKQALNGDKERMSQIKNAFNEWPQLSKSIIKFLDEFPKKYGFILSDEFKKKKIEIRSAIKEISNFQRSFFEKDANNRKFEEFWKAADKIRVFLNSLGNERNKYVIDIDPLLIRENHNEK